MNADQNRATDLTDFTDLLFSSVITSGAAARDLHFQRLTTAD